MTNHDPRQLQHRAGYANALESIFRQLLVQANRHNLIVIGSSSVPQDGHDRNLLYVTSLSVTPAATFNPDDHTGDDESNPG